MKSILTKDLYGSKFYIVTFLLLYSAFLFMTFVNTLETGLSEQGNSDTMYTLMFFNAIFSFVPVYLLQHDENVGFNKFALTMPISRDKYVSEKYIVCIITDLCCALGISSVGFLGASGGLCSYEQLWYYLMLGGAALLLVQALVMFIAFLIGAQKAAMVLFAFCSLVSLLGSVLLPIIFSGNEDLENFDISFLFTNTAAAYLLCGAALLFAVSWIGSVFVYRKRNI